LTKKAKRGGRSRSTAWGIVGGGESWSGAPSDVVCFWTGKFGKVGLTRWRKGRTKKKLKGGTKEGKGGLMHLEGKTQGGGRER